MSRTVTPAARITGRWRGGRALIVLTAIVMLAGDGIAKTTGTRGSRSPWKVQVVRTERPATGTLPQATAPKIQGQILEPVQIEDAAEDLQQAVLIHVRIVNRSDSSRILRWDVARSPYLRLPKGRTVVPLGHKLHGLADSSVVVRGVLEVEVAPKASYDLYPVFAVKPLPRGVKVVIDSVGVARLPR